MSLTLSLRPQDLAQRVLSSLDRPPPPPLWEWCCERLIMHDDRRFDASRAQILRRWYQRAQARLLRQPLAGDPAAHRAETLALVAASAFAKSTWIHACILWTLTHSPRRIGLFARRRDDVGETRRGRLEPMLRKTRPDLAPETAPLGPKLWIVNGGRLFFRCAGVIDDWRQEHYELLALDEADRYPQTLEGSADPMELRHGRQRPYRRSRLCLIGTTPSRLTRHGWRILCEGSHERPLILCPACGAADWLDPRRLRLAPAPGSTEPRDLSAADPDEIAAERLARWSCPWCGGLHDAAALRLMVDDCARADRWCPGTWAQDDAHPAGLWTPAAARDAAGRLSAPLPPAEGPILTGQANALYSHSVTLDDFAAATARALGQPETVVETLYSDTWAEPYLSAPGDEIDAQALAAAAAAGQVYRRGSLDRAADALLLILDQQGNRRDLYWYPWVLIAACRGGWTWRVDAGRGDARDLGRASARELHGDEVRDALTTRSWPIGPVDRQPDLLVMDCANGNFLRDAYAWAAQDPARRLLLRGSDGLLGTGIPWEEVPQSTRRGRARPPGVKEYRFDPHYWRDQLWDRVTARRGAPKWMAPPDMPDFYVNSLASEHPIEEERHLRGAGRARIRVWQPREILDRDGRPHYRRDNHWLACEAMALAALDILGFHRTDPLPTRRRIIRPGVFGALP